MNTPIGLPPELHALVDAVVADAGLLRGERDLVRAELETHFLDALEAGADPAAAAEAFGDHVLAAELIGRARRRNRPLVARLARHLALAAVCAAALLLVPYGYSAWRLGAAPASRYAPSFDTGLDWVPARATAIRARLDAAVLASDARRIEPLLAETAALREADALVPELESAHLYADLVGAYLQLRADPATPEHGRLRVELASDFAPRRTIVERALDEVLDRVYPPGRDGHPTRDGLRAVRRLKGGDPTWRADLLEPAYFLRVAGRAEAEALARDLVHSGWDESASADPAALRRWLTSHPSAERTFAVTLVMSRVASAMEAAQRAQRSLPAVNH